MPDLDTTELDAAPAAILRAYEERKAGRTVRVYLVTTYDDGTQHHRTGTIGKTVGGWKPCYLLMSSSRAIGSSDLLSRRTWENTVVAGIQNGDGQGYYVPGNTRGDVPGVTYRDERSPYGGTDFRVLPGRNRYTELTDTI